MTENNTVIDGFSSLEDTAPIPDILHAVPPTEDKPNFFQTVTENPTQEQEVFDPNIHAVNPDGSPRKKLDGTYARKRGRPAGGPIPPPPNTDDVLMAHEARVYTQLLTGLGASIFGPDWLPNQDERTVLETSFFQYFKEVGVVKMPPWVDLSLAISVGYILPRMHLESTKAKLAQISAKFHKRKKVNSVARNPVADDFIRAPD